MAAPTLTAPVLLGSVLMGSVLMGSALLGRGAQAQSVSCAEIMLPQPPDCRRANGDITVTMPLGENVERVVTAPGGDFDTTGFSISIDDQTVAGAKAPANPERRTDLAAFDGGIDLRFDGLDPGRILNVSTDDLRASYRAGEAVTFRTSSNYPAWISRAELRIVDLDARGRPVVAVLDAVPNGAVDWTMPADGSGRYAYALRVYDARGRYDETVLLDIARSTAAFADHAADGAVTAAGEGEDRARLRGIPVQGGRITVSGTAYGNTVRVMGEDVPVDPSGQFVISRVLPPGPHLVTVDTGATQLERTIDIPRSDWFRVGIVDLTFGKRLQDDLSSADPDFEDTYIDGRLAGFIKGRTARGYAVTGSIDTGEGPLEDAFHRLGDKDPRKVIARLDPDDLYPTYGDDSQSYDDAPTSGRFYLRVERDTSSLVWGDFKSDIAGNTFLNSSRALYGLELRTASLATGANGQPHYGASFYAAQPDTLPQRDILRGTGGSVYFLSHQDISGGSETLTIEVVDPVTGRVVSRQTLVEGVDFDIDYIQGVVILSRPLGSSAGDGGVIGSGTGEYDVNLVVQYEYTPTGGSLDGAALGGRVEVQATDNLRFGATAMRETTGIADQVMAGVDLHYQLGALSWIEAELAQTDGPGFGRSFSTDGGVTITPGGVSTGQRALGWRIDANLDLTDLGFGRAGHIAAYAEHKGEGFSTLTEDIAADQMLLGLEAEVAVSDRLTFGIDAEVFDTDAGDRRNKGEVRLAYALDPRWTIVAGLGLLDAITVGDADDTGSRTDLGLRLNYRHSDDLSLYGYGQATLALSGGIGRNDRLGFGFDARISEKLTASGEVSDGSKGVGAVAKLSYAPSADNEIYLGYTLDPTRTGPGFGTAADADNSFVAGSRFRYSDRFATYAENGWTTTDDRRSLTRTYGVTYTPDARWTFSGGLEQGVVRDDLAGDFDRDAVSFGVAYTGDAAQSARLRAEYRTEDGIGLAQDRDTWALSGGYEYKVSDDWRFIAGLDGLYSIGSDSFLDGEYLEASLGYAYRPVANDRLNVLLRYSYLRDLPGADQISSDGTDEGPLQISHIFGVDANYDLSPKLTLGGKYGFRTSQVSERGTGVFTDSTAQLAILRMDWHVVHKWDIMAEGRALFTDEIETTETGGLVGVYRHFGNNARVGVGYEFGNVSDDLSDIDYDQQGVFLNIVGTF